MLFQSSPSASTAVALSELRYVCIDSESDLMRKRLYLCITPNVSWVFSLPLGVIFQALKEQIGRLEDSKVELAAWKANAEKRLDEQHQRLESGELVREPRTRVRAHTHTHTHTHRVRIRVWSRWLASTVSS